ncbi:MAG: type IV-A pilus assembly ATPase PilB [Methylococcales bacterium]
MVTAAKHIQLTGLARCLVQAGHMEDADALAHHEESRKKKVPFVTYLVNNKILDGLSIAQSTSKEFGVPLFDLDAIENITSSISLVSEKLIRQHHALPLFKRGNRLFVAISDPTNVHALNEIKFHTGLTAETVLVEEEKLSRVIENALDAADNTMTDLMDDDLENLEVMGGDDIDNNEDVEGDIDETPIVRFVNKILLDAIKKGVSDIHIEPYEKKFRVRYRSDGILQEVAAPPANLANRITARLKVMSRMDIAERRVPQDGRIKMTLSKNRSIDFRVSTCPTLFGEKVVLRILDPTNAQMGIEKLGFEQEQQRLFLDAINKPYGMVLVTGPTGSGKTVSLYTGLNILNSPERNISTAEDPVEITVSGINQVNMNPKAGLTFATSLRAFLRQDPDIIMVGEIRDLETAEIAVKAAQTGHMVLSTLHTNDAPQTLDRLMQMGIPPFNIASSVVLIMAQRLARRLCEHCKTEEKLPEEVLIETGFRKDEFNELEIYTAGDGCDHCVGGYKGRVGIYQVMPITETLTRIILEGGNTLQLAEAAKQDGVNDLRESGLNKVREGITSLKELNRVTRE